MTFYWLYKYRTSSHVNVDVLYLFLIDVNYQVFLLQRETFHGPFLNRNCLIKSIRSLFFLRVNRYLIILQKDLGVSKKRHDFLRIVNPYLIRSGHLPLYTCICSDRCFHVSTEIIMYSCVIYRYIPFIDKYVTKGLWVSVLYTNHFYKRRLL